MIVNLIDNLRRRLPLLAKVGVGLLAALLLWDALLLDKSHAHSAAEKLPGFWALFALGAAVAIIIGAKIIGGILQTDEDYYDK